MRQRTDFVPDVMPHLSAGRHRNPRRGACFMEFASYLAGERWSDHPACTDRVLAALARGVNDVVLDERRDELVPLIPSVIGLRGNDSRLGLIIALRAATAALPVASMERQRALAVAVIACSELLAERNALEPELGVAAQASLAEVPDAERWARKRLVEWSVRPNELVRNGCEAIVRTAVVGIAQACISDPDDRLIRLLNDAVEDAEKHLGIEESRRAEGVLGATEKPPATLEGAIHIPSVEELASSHPFWSRIPS
jgi:hypothetical protein